MSLWQKIRSLLGRPKGQHAEANGGSPSGANPNGAEPSGTEPHGAEPHRGPNRTGSSNTGYGSGKETGNPSGQSTNGSNGSWRDALQHFRRNAQQDTHPNTVQPLQDSAEQLSISFTWHGQDVQPHGATTLDSGLTFPLELYELRRKSLARAGEKLACLYLKQVYGMTLIAANAKTSLTPQKHRVAGELDLIMDHEGLLVFVEVRSREGSYTRYSTPVSTVTHQKRQHICHAARLWLKQNGLSEIQRVRFDVVAVNWVINCTPEIEYIPNAFSWETPAWRKGSR